MAKDNFGFEVIGTADWFRCQTCGETPSAFACGCTRGAFDAVTADRDRWRTLARELLGVVEGSALRSIPSVERVFAKVRAALAEEREP